MRDWETNETDSAPVEPPRRRWWTAAHLLGFGALLALAILLAKGPPVDRADGGRVIFTEADLAHVRAAFERTWSRPPSASELRKAFDSYMRDEVLYREALARGLDRDDPLVKMSLVRKITMLGTVAAENAEPTDAELKAYFDLRSERYRIPASFDLLQVSLSRDKHGEQIEAVAAERLAQLREAEPSPEQLAEFSDIMMLPGAVRGAPEDELARTFGTEFPEAVMSLAVGTWEGPVKSGFGAHLVKVTHREESRIPEWTDVRDRIASDLQFESRKAAEDQFYAEVLPRYQVVYSEAVSALLEGADGRGDAAP